MSVASSQQSSKTNGNTLLRSLYFAIGSVLLDDWPNFSSLLRSNLLQPRIPFDKNQTNEQIAAVRVHLCKCPVRRAYKSKKKNWRWMPSKQFIYIIKWDGKDSFSLHPLLLHLCVKVFHFCWIKMNWHCVCSKVCMVWLHQSQPKIFNFVNHNKFFPRYFVWNCSISTFHWNLISKSVHIPISSPRRGK